MKFAYMWGTFASMFFGIFAMYFKNSYRVSLKSNAKRLYHLFAFLAFIPLTFLSAVRYNIGTDYPAYIEIFQEGGNAYRYTEPGFWLYVQAMRLFTDDPRVCMAITSTFLGAVYYWLIFKESENPVYSILIYVLSREYFCSTDGLRQYMAMAILMFAIPLIRKGGVGRWILVMIITAIAYTFHTTTIVVIPLYLLFMLNLEPWTSGFLVVAVYAITTSAMPFVQNSVILMTRFGHYITKLKPAFEASTFLTFLCLTGMTATFVKKIDRRDSQTRLFYNANVFGMCTLAFAACTHWAVIRLCYFANPYMIVYLPHVMKKIKPKWLKGFAYFGITVCFLIVCNFVTLSGNQTVLGYKTIWQT